LFDVGESEVTFGRNLRVSEARHELEEGSQMGRYVLPRSRRASPAVSLAFFVCNPLPHTILQGIGNFFLI
jgi:hypothetical protein